MAAALQQLDLACGIHQALEGQYVVDDAMFLLHMHGERVNAISKLFWACGSLAFPLSSGLYKLFRPPIST